MSYVETFDRNQIMMCSWDLLVEPESIATNETVSMAPAASEKM